MSEHIGTEEEHIGYIDVDAGLCWIGDPCYIIPNEEGKTKRFKDWRSFCNELHENENNYQHHEWPHQLGHQGLGITVETGYGDGSYPVFIKTNEDGRVAEVIVRFIS